MVMVITGPGPILARHGAAIHKRASSITQSSDVTSAQGAQRSEDQIDQQPPPGTYSTRRISSSFPAGSPGGKNKDHRLGRPDGLGPIVPMVDCALVPVSGRVTREVFQGEILYPIGN